MKQYFFVAITALSLTIITSCSDETVNDNITSEEISELDGKSLMEKNCTACHGNGTSHDNILGPPMRGVKNHYLEDGMTEAEFIDAIVAWTKNPSEENSKMPGAIEKFNVMPKQEFNTEEVKAIASYMFNNEMEKPQWFDKHMEEDHNVMEIEGLELNDGKKWEANPETTKGINKMIDLAAGLNDNASIEDYQSLALELDVIKGEILSECTMDGVAHDNLHTFLMPLIRKINGLKEVESIEKAKKIFGRIKLNLELYSAYFI